MYFRLPEKYKLYNFIILYKFTNDISNLDGLCWGPPKPKLRFIVGEATKNKSNRVEIEAKLPTYWCP